MTEKPAMPPEMWIPLLLMVLGVYLLFAVMLMVSARSELLYRERNTRWVQDLVRGGAERSSEKNAQAERVGGK